jgi:hypothetical protein
LYPSNPQRAVWIKVRNNLPGPREKTTYGVLYKRKQTIVNHSGIVKIHLLKMEKDL